MPLPQVGETMYISHESTNVGRGKRGRPKSIIPPLASYIIEKYPLIAPKELQRLTFKSFNIRLSRTYAKVLLHRYRVKYHIKLPFHKTKYRNKLYRNNKYNNNNLHRHSIHSQLLPTDPYDMILSFIYTRERKDRRFIECLNSLYPDGYKNTLGQYRYDNDYTLSIKDKRGRLRRFIQRLKNRETPVSKNHIHYHGQKRKLIEYHIGNHKNHDLCKYLCTLLGIPFKSRIYLPHGRFFSTDCSGIDVSHLEVLRNLFYTNLETQLEGTALLEKSFYHGKLVVGNQVKHIW